MGQQQDRIGVLPLAVGFVFCYPAPLTSVDAPRVGWQPLEGVTSVVARTTQPLPTLAAVLIVKDEERRLPRCLDALVDVVDEVVVYDTGSSDSTVTIARASGATVVEGFWDDDFGAARNRALEHATSEWVLSVDADEVLETDRDELLAWLASVEEDLCLVRLESTTTEGAAHGHESRLSRLFRREKTTWANALHEQPVAKGGGALRMCQSIPPLRLLHSGYTIGHEKVGEKAERNLRISRRAFEAVPTESPAWPQVAVDYARSLALAGRAEEVLSTTDQLADREMERPLVVQVARSVVPLLLSPDRAARAAHWVDRAAAAGESPGLVSLWRAQVQGVRGDITGGVAALEHLVSQPPVETGFDLWGKEFDAVSATSALARAYDATGRSAAAADLLTTMMQDEPDRVPVEQLLLTAQRAGRRLEDLALLAPDALVRRSLLETTVVAPALALAWYRALHAARPLDERVLAVGSAAAARTSVEAALEWSVLSREAGLGEGICALRWLAEGEVAHPRTRALAWAVLVHGFGQAVDGPLLEEAVDRLSGDDAAEVLDTLRRLLPEVASLRPHRPSLDHVG
nr:glycosyltransferase family 2 protein [Quadrisphaera sp. RL12-1S]